MRFGDRTERDLAMMEMNGKACHQRIMRISSATTKRGRGGAPRGAAGQRRRPRRRARAATLYVRGLDAAAPEGQLRSAFERYGELEHLRVANGAGTVRYASRSSAERAVAALDGAASASGVVSLRWSPPPPPMPQGFGGGQEAGAAAAMMYVQMVNAAMGGYYGPSHQSWEFPPQLAWWGYPPPVPPQPFVGAMPAQYGWEAPQPPVAWCPDPHHGLLM